MAVKLSIYADDENADKYDDEDDHSRDDGGDNDD
jgi:hypothetical protein